MEQAARRAATGGVEERGGGAGGEFEGTKQLKRWSVKKGSGLVGIRRLESVWRWIPGWFKCAFDTVVHISFPCGLRGPVAADLHGLRFAHPLETSPPRHPFAQLVL